MNEIKLKTCPFCSSKAQINAIAINVKTNETKYTVICTGFDTCNVRPSTALANTPLIAAKMWNDRLPDLERAYTLTAIRERLDYLEKFSTEVDDEAD